MYITTKLEGNQYVNKDESKVISIDAVGPKFTEITVYEYGLEPNSTRIENWKLGIAFREEKIKFASRSLIYKIKNGINFTSQEENFGREMQQEKSSNTNPLQMNAIYRKAFLDACI